MINTPVNAALSSITLDDVLNYIRKEMTVLEGSSNELQELLTSVDEEAWLNDMTRYRTRVEELDQKFKEAGVEINTVGDFHRWGGGVSRDPK